MNISAQCNDLTMESFYAISGLTTAAAASNDIYKPDHSVQHLQVPTGNELSMISNTTLNEIPVMAKAVYTNARQFITTGGCTFSFA